MSSMMRTMVMPRLAPWLLAGFLVATSRNGVIGVQGDTNAFTYFEKDSERGRGVSNWDAVDDQYQYFPWDKHLRLQDSNDCRDRRTSGSSHRQSPINIRGEKGCGSASNDDDHRHWTMHGECTLHDVGWTIEPWGLLMTFPYGTGSGQNPERDPCGHPMMDSSGGYGDAFFANYVTVVSPSEHYIDGEQFDAEINIAHFNYGTKLPMIFSVLARADSSYPDNPILEPYLREWERVHADNRQKCESHLKHCPVTASQLNTGDLTDTTASSTDSKGIMFDMETKGNNDVAIKAFDINVNNQGGQAHTFKVYTRTNGSKGTHVGYEKNSGAWEEISNVHVFGMGEDEPSRLTLDVPYLLKRGEKIGFYIYHENDNDLMNANSNVSTGWIQKSTNDLTLYVGTVLGSSSGRYSPFTGTTYTNRGFAGNVYYSKCDLPASGTSSSYTINAHTPNGQKAGLELSQSIDNLSANGYNYIGCFNKGGDNLDYKASGKSNEECSDLCRNSGSKFFVRRQGGTCYCTDGEYAYSGHADKCSCDQTSNIGGYDKQCAFRVMPTYLGCFKNTNSQDTFEVRMTQQRGLSLAKCEEVCFDAGYRYVGRQWKGICYCSNTAQYDKYGTTTGCKCEDENVGSYKFCAFDLGPDKPPMAQIRSSSNYSSNRKTFKGCYKDAGDRALPVYMGRKLSDNQCAQKCYDANFRYFGIQYFGECYCGDGDYSRHGTSNSCSCNSSNKGGWVLCVYEFTSSRRRALGDEEGPAIGDVIDDGEESTITSATTAEIQADGRLRITAQRNEQERQVTAAMESNFANATKQASFATVVLDKVKCSEEHKLSTDAEAETILKKGVMFDLQATAPYEDDSTTVAIRGFDLHLSTNFLENGGAMRNLRVFTRPKSYDGLGSWTNLGTFHVISLGQGLPSSLDLHEPLHIPLGDIQTFVIRDSEQQADIANAVVHGKTFGAVQQQDTHLVMMINPESKPQMNATMHMTSLSFHGTIHYSLCREEAEDVPPEEGPGGDPEMPKQNAQTERKLDGGPRDMDWGPFDWAIYPEFDVYRLLTTPWFYRYRGSYTKPMCFDEVRWRVFKEPMQISIRQKTLIDELIKEMLDPNTCKKATVGKPRFDGTDYVDVNRPLQRKHSKHDLYICDSDYWKSQGFFNTPRGNTNWQILEDKGLFVPDEHWDEP